jgi:regulator of replication initiation timing
MDSLEQFNSQITNIIQVSKLPSSVLTMCLTNIILQIQVGKLQQELEEKKMIINKINEVEMKTDNETK